DAAGARERRRAPPRGRARLRRRREMQPLHLGPRRLLRDVHGLSGVLPDRPADPGHRCRLGAGARREVRDRGDWRAVTRPGQRDARPGRSGAGVDTPGGEGQVPTTSSSIATGRPLLDTAMRIVWVPPDGNARANSTIRAWNVDRRRLTAATNFPSRYPRAVPRVGPTGPIQEIPVPVNRNVAASPVRVEYF